MFRGTSPDISVAIETRDFDNAFRLDFGKVLEIANNKPAKVAKFYGSRPPNRILYGIWQRKSVLKLLLLTEITVIKKKG